MTNVPKLVACVGALLALSLAPPTTAEAQSSTAGDPTAMSPDHPRYASGYYAIGQDFYEGSATKAEIEARVAKMHQNRSQRRKEHAEGLVTRWGGKLLNDPKARDELRVHARREAYTARALFLAHTDESLKDRKQLVERLEAIIDTEELRHNAVMEALKSAPAAWKPGVPTAPPASP